MKNCLFLFKLKSQQGNIFFLRVTLNLDQERALATADTLLMNARATADDFMPTYVIFLTCAEMACFFGQVYIQNS